MQPIIINAETLKAINDFNTLLNNNKISCAVLTNETEILLIAVIKGKENGDLLKDAIEAAICEQRGVQCDCYIAEASSYDYGYAISISVEILEDGNTENETVEFSLSHTIIY